MADDLDKTTAQVSPESSKDETQNVSDIQESPTTVKDDSASPDSSTDSSPNDDTQSPPQDVSGPTSEEMNLAPTASATSSTPWQAIFSPQYNAYYFYNSETHETTWENPLLSPDGSLPNQALGGGPETPSGDPSGPASGYSTSSHNALQAAAIAAGIDPSLAHLDPSLLASLPSGSGVTAPGLAPTFTAKFNARTGQFTRPDGRDPTHLSEYNRAMRMSEFYFDVNAWQDQLAEQGGSIQGPEEGRKRKRPTKKDLERFKEQKRLKKIAKTAWLRT